MVRGTPRGYFPEPTNIILIVSPWNVLQSEAFFQGYGLHIMMGSLYLGGFVGYKDAHDCWLGEKVEGWQDSVATLAGVARQHPKTAYTGLQKSLQQEWDFLQHATPDIGMEFQG